MKEIISQKAPEPVGAYPHARKVGDLLFLSGVGPRQRGSKDIPGVILNEFGEVQSYNVAEQTHAVIKNIELVLQDAGATLKDLVDVQVFLINMKQDFPIFNQVYAQYFDVETGPCRTTIEVGALPTPIAVEIKAIARLA
ncbi:MAG: RidA family protein [Bdellovibrionaceae bacterium]|nr:RidA family protein [Pseudobdellovibrionaceae bacterium]